jgi:hypothetical protein
MENPHRPPSVEQMQAEGATFRTGVAVGSPPKGP